MMTWFRHTAIFILICGCTATAKDVVDFVNPLIGTSIQGFKPGLGGGGAMPCVGWPFAMTNFVAQTEENHIGKMVYSYESNKVYGFIATHQPTVWMGDYGYVSVMPEMGQLKVLSEDRALGFKHTDEIARPDYYSVKMDAGDGQMIHAEIAAASRCGIIRFTFPKSDQAYIVIQSINLDPAMQSRINDVAYRTKTMRGYVKVDAAKREITGFNEDRQSAKLGPPLPNFKGYFVIQFDKPIASFGTWSENGIHANSVDETGTRMGAYIGFKTKKHETVQVRIATSFISIEQARENLQHESPGWNFDKLVRHAHERWDDALGRMKVDGATDEQKAIFYTAMFHTLLFPREFSEYGHYYSAFDDRVHEGISYNDYSLWDTFRAEHPLLIFIQPERINAMVASLVQMYKEGGWMPKWPNPTYTNIMIGTHADEVVADAYMKGFRGYDTAAAYEAARKDCMIPPDDDTNHRWGDRDSWTAYEAQGGLTYYKSLGYVPVDKTAEAVSRTIEYSYEDYCVAQMAKAMGHDIDYQQLMAMSRNYKNLYNPATGFFAPKRFDGNWNKNPNQGFTEGANWTYLFGALHDVPGMIQLMGGDEKFAAKLDENFAAGHYRHDNEPGHHYIYLYDWCGKPWRTQELARENTRINYRDEPNGVNGNDDCGQMSAWYLFSVMGFYPVTPATGEFAIGAPQFPKLSLKLHVNGKSKWFEIIANQLSEKNLYVQSAALDGVAIQHPFLKYADIISGHRLVFEMCPTPNRDWK